MVAHLNFDILELNFRFFSRYGTKNSKESSKGGNLLGFELKLAQNNSTMQPSAPSCPFNSIQFLHFFSSSNKQKMKEILNLHLVNERFSSEKIRSNNNNKVNWTRKKAFLHCTFVTFFRPFIPFNPSQIVQVSTNADKKYLYFNVVNRDEAQTITVEGGGVNATIIQSDIASTNGFVHIIDHVLGIPYTSVFEKLQTDPMLK